MSDQKKKLLYISVNDGSDTRINKQIRSLEAEFDIYFLGIGESRSNNFINDYCKSVHIVIGKRKSISSLIKLTFVFLKHIFSRRYHSWHVINEQLMMLFYPWIIFNRKIVLDLFDSIFLKKGDRFTGAKTLRWLLYSIPKKIIVTDDNRLGLFPQKYKHKAIVLENYPYQYEGNREKSPSEKVRIYYNGTMNTARGSELVRKLIETYPNDVEIHMAGWLYDDYTKAMAELDGINFHGVLPQQESMKVAASCDFILCVYEPSNDNNINASPNKIYDAIQSGSLVIINGEVKISSFVKEHNIGWVMPDYYKYELSEVLNSLKKSKETMKIPESLRSAYVWESIEHRLIKAHHA